MSLDMHILCFGGHIGRHLGQYYSHTIANAMVRFLDLETITMDTLFVILAYV